MPLDIYIEVPDDIGGFIRHYEIAEIVRVAAPVYLKFGLRNAPNIYPSGTHLEATAVALTRERLRRARLGLDLLRRLDPDGGHVAAAGACRRRHVGRHAGVPAMPLAAAERGSFWSSLRRRTAGRGVARDLGGQVSQDRSQLWRSLDHEGKSEADQIARRVVETLRR